MGLSCPKKMIVASTNMFRGWQKYTAAFSAGFPNGFFPAENPGHLVLLYFLEFVKKTK